MGDGYRTFAGGETLTAANVMGYLMEQAVMVFADGTARDAAVSTPEEGMACYLTGTNMFQLYDGSSWQDIIDAAGEAQGGADGPIVATTLSASGDAAFDTDTLFVDVSTDRVGINDSTPSYSLDVNGTLRVTGQSTFAGATFSSDLNVDSGVLFADVSTNRVGINDTSPSHALDVTGTGRFTADLIVGDQFTVGKTSIESGRTFHVEDTDDRGSEIYRGTATATAGIVVFSSDDFATQQSQFIFYADGDAAKASGAGDWEGISDDRMKNILDRIDPDEALRRFAMLDPVVFEYTHLMQAISDDDGRQSDVVMRKLDQPKPPQAGVYASNFEKAFPELVKERGSEAIKTVPVGSWDAWVTAAIIGLIRRG